MLKNSLDQKLDLKIQALKEKAPNIFSVFRAGCGDRSPSANVIHSLLGVCRDVIQS